MAFVEKLVGWLWGMPLIVTILGTGFFLMFMTKGFVYTHFGHVLSQTFGKILKRDAGAGKEGVLSSFEAISVAVGGTVGVGNIAGVASAIAIGGPGAVFWIWVAAILGQVIKMAEVTLAVYYRKKDEKGNPYGGPTFYMERGLGEEKGFKAWKILAIIFAGGLFSSFILTLQCYSVSEAVGNTFGLPLLVVGGVYVALTYLMIMGGIPWLGKAASNVVPFMCLFYILGGLFIILKNIGMLDDTFRLIFGGAFKGSAAVGGFAGAAFAAAIKTGMARAVYSNEAGWGTSPMIHSTSRVDHPVRQGLWGVFEVFVDTIIVCTITALVVIITGEWSSGLSGATLTLSAFEKGMGSFGRIVVTIGVFLFGITTTTGWYAYYEILLRHAMGDNSALKDKILTFYKWIYPAPGFAMVLFAVLSEVPSGKLWLFADLTAGIPTFVNVLVVLILSPKFFALVKDYRARHLGEGTVDPNFKIFYDDFVEAKVKTNSKPTNVTQ